jgi:hypothetical protein
MTVTNELKPPLEEALEHYGVKGMKWGVRRDQATLDRKAGRKPSRVKRAVKAVSKASKERDQEIKDARSKKPALKKEVKEARKQYKIDKKEVGRKEAKKALRAAKDKKYENLNIASEQTTPEALERMVLSYIMKEASKGNMNTPVADATIAYMWETRLKDI